MDEGNYGAEIGAVQLLCKLINLCVVNIPYKYVSLGPDLSKLTNGYYRLQRFFLKVGFHSSAWYLDYLLLFRGGVYDLFHNGKG